MTILTMSLLTEWGPQSQLEPPGIIVIQKIVHVNDFVDVLRPLFSLESIFKVH